jgi:hypothetical protein
MNLRFHQTNSFISFPTRARSVALLLLVLCLTCILSASPAFANATEQGQGFGNSGGGVNVADIPVITTTNQPALDQERALAVEGTLTLTDGGAGGSITVGTGTNLDYFATLGSTADTVIAALFGGQAVVPDDGASFGYTTLGGYGWSVGAGSGDITSVDIAVPNFFSISGVPDLNGAVSATIGYASGLTANQVLQTDSGGTAKLAALTAAHIPNLAGSIITSGTVAAARLPATIVYNDQSNTFSGTFTQDLSASTQTFKPPAKTMATNGEAGIDSSDWSWRTGGTNYKAAKQSTSINVTSPITGGGTLAADRTIGLGTVTTANGGAGQTSTPANGKLFIGNGTTAMSVANITAGAGIGVSNGSGSITISNTATPAFGGNGADGAVTVNSTPVTQDEGKQINSTAFTVTNAGQLYVYTYPQLIQSQSTITVDGDIIIDTLTLNGAEGFVGDGYGGARGGGPGGGEGGKEARDGGNGGAGSFTRSGAGGRLTSGGYTQPPMQMLAFSGGGGHGLGASGGAVTASNFRAGHGLPPLAFIAVGAILFDDECHIVGRADDADALPNTSRAGGSGGGGGPTVLAASQVSIVTDAAANIELTGGDGGDGGNSGNNCGGGGGGGGTFFLYAPSVTNSCIPTLDGGTGGAQNSSGVAGGSGEDGSTVVVIGTPNSPILSFLNNGGFERVASGELTSHKEICMAAANGDVVRYFEILCERTTEVETTCIGIGDLVEGLDNAA